MRTSEHFGGLLLARHERDGRIDDLEVGASLARSALPTGSRDDRAILGAVLAVILHHLGERMHTLAPLDEGVKLLRDAIGLLGRRSPHASTCLGALGQLHLTRFELTSAPEDLLAASSAFARALQRAAPAGSATALLRSSLGATKVAPALSRVRGTT